MQTEALESDVDDRGAWMEESAEMLANGHGVGLAQHEDHAIRRANRLGWFGVALGAVELLAPHAVASLVGARVRPSRSLMSVRFMGMREIALGIGILSQRNRAPWLFARVAGDLVDLAILGKTLASRRSDHARTRAAIASVIGVTAMDLKTAIELSQHGREDTVEHGIHVLSAITVNRSREDVYAFWRDFEHLPLFMSHLESVEVHGSRSTWRAKGIGGMTFRWDAEFVADQPNESIAWRSCAGADVPNQGSVHFLDAPGGRGTEVRVELRYDPPAGKVGAKLAKLFGKEPGQEITGDLRRFKQVIETGEVLHSDASIHKWMHPARPSASRRDDRRETEPEAGRTKAKPKAQPQGKQVTR
ncbi:MAG: SRPBCC family protein [Polyangiaceae bacterium]